MTTILVWRRATSVVEEWDLWEYLKGVIPCEVYADWPMAALEAQGLAVVSYALYAIVHPRHRTVGAHVCDSTHCQVFNPQRRDPRTDEAVENIRDMFIYYKPVPGMAIEAVYSAACDSYTKAAKDVWGNDVPYLQAVPCACGRPVNGHQVGLCQWGTYEMAKQGLDAKQIVLHYYTNCEVANWEPEPPPEPPPERPEWCDILAQLIDWLRRGSVLLKLLYQTECAEQTKCAKCGG